CRRARGLAGRALHRLRLVAVRDVGARASRRGAATLMVRGVLRIGVVLAAIGSSMAAQDAKPLPKGSIRVSIPGCSRGYVFTTGPRTADEAGSANVPDGLHLRMNGPKKLINEIKAH